jgi:hypothetical protein
MMSMLRLSSLIASIKSRLMYLAWFALLLPPPNQENGFVGQLSLLESLEIIICFSIATRSS